MDLHRLFQIQLLIHAGLWVIHEINNIENNNNSQSNEYSPAYVQGGPQVTVAIHLIICSVSIESLYVHTIISLKGKRISKKLLTALNGCGNVFL